MTGLRSISGTPEFTVQLPRGVERRFPPADPRDVLATTSPLYELYHIFIALICEDSFPIQAPCVCSDLVLNEVFFVCLLLSFVC